jgi:prolyl-tRNA editing enzyme YbaK/EbsC (Cys-tRNA(Pro) deacylase)
MRNSVDVHNYLVERDVRHELFRVKGRLRNPDRLAAVLELSPDEVGRVTIFETDGDPILAVTASDGKLDPELVKQAAAVEELKKVSPSRASQLADYVADAIPPVALPKGFRVVMDKELAEREVVYFNGGDPNAVLKLRGEDLARAAEATVAKLG